MMTEWIGQSLSVEINDCSVYQGSVAEIDTTTSAITLKNAFKNGKPCSPAAVTILATQIKSLEFVEPCFLSHQKGFVVDSSDDDTCKTKQQRPRKNHVQVFKADTYAQQKRTVHQRTRSNSFTAVETGNKSSENRTSMNKFTHSKTDRDSCFNIHIDSCMGDFDFEKNLALFDKQRVFGEIEREVGSGTPKKPDKYRHDEMIIKSAKAARPVKSMDCDENTPSYITDEGLIVPCLTYQLREQLFLKAASYGLTEKKRVDIVGRNLCDMVFQLIGGSTRMNPQNSHQKPTIVILSGPHVQGCYGISCARHLANHNINTVMYVPLVEATHCLLEEELRLYDLCGMKRITAADELPTSTVDLIINCTDNEEMLSLHLKPWYKYITNWCNTSRAHVLSIDPSVKENFSIETKWSVHIGIPQKLPACAGLTYLCDIGVPKEIFKQLGIKYRSPFGIKFCIPLHSH